MGKRGRPAGSTKDRFISRTGSTAQNKQPQNSHDIATKNTAESTSASSQRNTVPVDKRSIATFDIVKNKNLFDEKTQMSPGSIAQSSSNVQGFDAVSYQTEKSKSKTASISGGELGFMNLTSERKFLSATRSMTPTNGAPMYPIRTDLPSRQKQVRSIIEHRRILVERMRQCRKSAEIRIGIMKTQSNIKSDHSSNTSNDGSTTVNKQKSLIEQNKSRDETEIFAFRELSRQTINAAKKQRTMDSDGIAQEKRGSISLRRGSSVGKRMSAALSTLVPSTPANVVSSTSTVLLESQKLPLNHSNATVTSSVNTPPGVTPTTGRPPSTISHSSPTLLIALHPSTSTRENPPRMTPTALKGPINAIETGQIVQSTKGNASIPGAIGHKKRGVAKNQRKACNATSSSAASNSDPYTVPSFPLHSGAGVISLPINRLAQPSVICPEAIALRAKKNALRTKLALIIHERRKRIDEAYDFGRYSKLRSSRPSSPTFSTIPTDSNELLSFDSTTTQTLNLSKSTKVPCRRKTHWDYLLEEMKWLATDFIEERKWKYANARIISSAAVLVGVSVVCPPTSKTKNSDRSKDDATEKRDIEGESSKSNSKSHHQKEKKTEPESQSKYTLPSPSDTKLTRDAAAVISNLVSELWDVTVEFGAFPAIDKIDRLALVRCMKRREAIVKGNSSFEKSCRNGEIASCSESKYDDQQKEKKSENLAECDEEMVKHVPEELPYNRITERMKTLSELIDNEKGKKSKTDKQLSKQFDTTEIPLTSRQLHAVDLVERIWCNDNMGAIIDGESGCGKTITVCSLLWRTRTKGPHLIICAPARLIRWRHELARFDGLRVLLFGPECGIGSPTWSDTLIRKYVPGDIVLSDYSSLLGFNKNEKDEEEWALEMSPFYSITLDARNSVATNGSFPDFAEKTNDTQGKKVCFSPQLASRTWWTNFLNSFSSLEANRLLVECHRFGLESTEITFDCSTSVGVSQCLEMLASKVAFILGPTLFYAENKPVVKKVLSWIKRRAKEETTGVSKNNKLERIKIILLRLLNHFSHQFEKPHFKENKSRNKRLTWEVRLCELTPEQRIEYDRCCSDVRGALSWLKTTRTCNPYKVAGNALMQLRQACLHPQVDSVLHKTIKPGTYRYEHSKKPPDRNWHTNNSLNPSQPDVNLALEILRMSAKMRELTRILHLECGYRFAGENAILEAIGENYVHSVEEVSRSKVAILASLPEAQLLTSTLLSALGLAHELLLAPSPQRDLYHKPKTSLATSLGPSNCFGVSSSVPTYDTDATVAWIKCQLALSRFNTYDNENGSEQFSDLLISSPVTIGSENGGLGAHAAEYCISVDEDWSGRCEMLMKVIRASHSIKNGAVKAGRGQDCELIRLACATTCEELFAIARCQKSTPTRWPIDIFGYLYVPSSLPLLESLDAAKAAECRLTKQEQSVAFSFPGTNILKFRNEDLSTVLCTDQLPPDLFTGTAMSFLPTLGEDGENAAGISFAHSLIQNEALFCPLSSRSGESQRAEIGEISSLDRYLTIVPPQPSEFPPNIITRSDLNLLPSRVFIQDCGKSLVNSSLASVSRGGTLQMKPETLSSLSSPKENAELVDSWLQSSLICKPDHLAASLLTYSSTSQRTNQKESQNQVIIDSKQRSQYDTNIIEIIGEQQRQQAEVKSTSIELSATDKREDMSRLERSSTRMNQYSIGYSNTNDGQSTCIKDGNQGYEPLVYFPPLFPGIFLQSQRSIIKFEGAKDIKVNREWFEFSKDTVSGFNPVIDVTLKKRKDIDSVVVLPAPSGKRPRTQASSTSLPLVLPQPVKPNAAHAHQTDTGVEGVEKVNEDNTSIAFRKSAIIDNNDLASILTEVNEDFGLAGIGAVSLAVDAVRVASTTTTNVADYSKWEDLFESDSASNDMLSGVLACDPEEADAARRNDTSLNSVLLYVARIRRQVNLPAFSLQLSGLQGNFMSNQGLSSITMAKSSGGMGNSLTVDSKINGAGIKKKKKFQNQSSKAGQSAFSRLPPMSVPIGQLKNKLLTAETFSSVKTKDGYRNKVASLFPKRGSLGLSLFEFSTFRLAAIRIRDRVSDRVSQASLAASATSGIGSGLPLVATNKDLSYATSPIQLLADADDQPNRWTSLVTKLAPGNGKSGDDAKSISSAQRTFLCRSLNSPRRVDFGPFDSGFLALIEGMSGISPPCSRIGISLPMGVKVPQQQREQHLNLDWANPEDSKLQEYTTQYGLNWSLAARAVTGWGGVNKLHLSNDNSNTINQRSAKQCRERWNSIIQTQPFMANEVRKSERSSRENAVLKPNQIHDHLKAVNLYVPIRPRDTGASSASVGKPLGSNGEAALVIETSNSGNVLMSELFKVTCINEMKEGSATMKEESNSDVVVPMTAEQAEKTRQAMTTTKVFTGKKRKRTFNLLSNCSNKRQEMPITIPGYSGSGKPTLVPSHKSHMDSVQAAVAAASSRTRGDMWPLQILDLADKKRGTSSSTNTSIIVGSSNGKRQHHHQRSHQQHRQPPLPVPQATTKSQQVQRKQPFKYQQPPPPQMQQIQPPPPSQPSVPHQTQPPNQHQIQPPPQQSISKMPLQPRTNTQSRDVPQPLLQQPQYMQQQSPQTQPVQQLPQPSSPQPLPTQSKLSSQAQVARPPGPYPATALQPSRQPASQQQQAPQTSPQQQVPQSTEQQQVPPRFLATKTQQADRDVALRKPQQIAPAVTASKAPQQQPSSQKHQQKLQKT